MYVFQIKLKKKYHYSHSFQRQEKKEFHQDTHLDISYRNRNSLVRDNHVVISRTSLILSVSYYFQLFIFGA